MYGPLLSVVIPIFNTQAWLGKCIDSILQQTLSAIEILLIDDGSTDYSRFICEAYADMDSRIRLFHLSNRGVSAARNLGIKNAKGKYVMFCDSDDYVGRDWCRIAYEHAVQHPNAWIGTGVAYVDAYGSVISKKTYGNGEEKTVITKENYLNAFMHRLHFNVYTGIYERKLIYKNSVYFDETMDYAEDVLFRMQYMKYKEYGVVVNSPISAFYFYRKLMRDSLSTRFLGMKYFNMLKKSFYEYRYFIRTEEYEAYLKWQFNNLCLEGLQQVFDSRSPDSLEQKLKDCQKIVNSQEFRECCFTAISEAEENPVLIELRKGDFYSAYSYITDAVLKKEHNKFY